MLLKQNSEPPTGIVVDTLPQTLSKAHYSG